MSACVTRPVITVRFTASSTRWYDRLRPCGGVTGLGPVRFGKMRLDLMRRSPPRPTGSPDQAPPVKLRRAVTQRVTDAIFEMLRSGRYRVGDRLPSE
jgi:hypothetical protein